MEDRARRGEREREERKKRGLHQIKIGVDFLFRRITAYKYNTMRAVKK